MEIQKLPDKKKKNPIIILKMLRKLEKHTNT